MVAGLVLVVLVVGGIVAWFKFLDTTARHVRGADKFPPIEPMPDDFAAKMLARAPLCGREPLLDLGFVKAGDGQFPSILLPRKEWPHFFCVGRTGSGKTFWWQTLVLAAIRDGHASGRPVSCILVSPHAADLVGMLPILGETGLPVGFVDLSASTGGITGWSPFTPRAGASAEEVANRCLAAVATAFQKDFTATPELRQVLQAAFLLLVAEPDLTIDQVGDALLDPDKGKIVYPKIPSAAVKAFLARLWSMSQGQRVNIVRHGLPKLAAFTSAETARWTLNQRREHLLRVEDFLERPGILAFHPAPAKVGDLAPLYTALFLEDLRGRLFARMDPFTKPTVLFVIDEVAELLAKGGSGVGEVISLLLSGGRKANVVVVAVCQDLYGQVADKRLASELLSQCSKILFQLGRHDAQAFAKDIVLPTTKPPLWPGDWSCEGARVGSLDPDEWLHRSKKDRQDDTYFSLLSLPPRAFYLQTTIDRVLETRLVYTHDRPESHDPRAFPPFVGMRPIHVVRDEVEHRRPPWEGTTRSTPSPSGRGTRTARHAAPTGWV